MRGARAAVLLGAAALTSVDLVVWRLAVVGLILEPLWSYWVSVV